MRILQVAPYAVYNEYWGYQENLLPKYQKKLGNEVILVIPNQKHENGQVVQTEVCDKVLEDGVRIIRRPYVKKIATKLTSLYSELDIRDILEDFKPDFIYIHGLTSMSIFQAIDYKRKNPNTVLVLDNHLDYNNGMNARSLKDKVLRFWYRNVCRKALPSVDKIYAVTPWRKTYAEDYFKIPAEKIDILLMGADDEHLDFEHRSSIRQNIRALFDIQEDEFLIISGGKIDKAKNMEPLVEACASLPKVRLMLFGSPVDQYKENYDALLSKFPSTIDLGWIDASNVYNYYFAADLICFPGTHSVLWEQACASKTPCLFKRWTGMDHVNNGGNAAFFEETSKDGIKKTLQNLVHSPSYEQMLQIAQSENTDVFLYSGIAEKSLECAKSKI